jgi:cell division protein FtsB
MKKLLIFSLVVNIIVSFAIVVLANENKALRMENEQLVKENNRLTAEVEEDSINIKRINQQLKNILNKFE